MNLLLVDLTPSERESFGFVSPSHLSRSSVYPASAIILHLIDISDLFGGRGGINWIPSPASVYCLRKCVAGDTNRSHRVAGDTSRSLCVAGDTSRSPRVAGDTSRSLRVAGDTSRSLCVASSLALSALRAIPAALSSGLCVPAAARRE